MTWGLPDWLFHWAGHFGVAFYLGSYALLQAGVIRGSSLTYTVMNLIAASLVFLSLAVAFNLSSALIQISWILISIVGLTRMAIEARGLRFSDAEAQMMRGPLAHMPGRMARRFFDAGRWETLQSDTDLTQEDNAVHALYYLVDGEAEVISGDSTIAVLNVGFVGEMNVMEAGPASATVRARAGATLFQISGQTLRKMVDRDDDLRQVLGRALTRDTATKLQSANRRLANRWTADTPSH